MVPLRSLVKLGSRLPSRLSSRTFASEARVPHVCVIGSGPAGFYTAQVILKNHPQAKVDMYEKLPVPFGLVRYGVAPDHPEVKNVINSFTKLAGHERFSFIGNVHIGKDIVLEDLQAAYTAIVLASGASEDRKLEIPGEERAISARRLVGWYNGSEEDAKLNVNLDVEDIAIVGHGNVALDVGRILLMSVDTLKQKTDITQHALEALSKSRVRRVHLIGRRGPLQVAFTIKELREMINLPGCRSVFHEDDFKPIVPLIEGLPRPRKRLIDLMAKTALEPNPKTTECDREFHLQFLRSPLEILLDGSSRIKGLKLELNKLQETGNSVKAIPTGKSEVLSCGMVVTSVGYKSVPLFPNIPFDSKSGSVPNKGGRVEQIKGLYCSGWVKTGPVGVILTTMNDSFDTGNQVVHDIKKGILPNEDKKGRMAIDEVLRKKGVQTTSFSDWLKIDKVEKERGAKLGKPREKIISVSEMLRIARS